MAQKPETKYVWKPLQRSKCLKDLDPYRIETDTVLGFPDVEMIGCTLELKYVPDYPKRATTNVNVKSVSAPQRLWWEKRQRKGGRVFVLLRIKDDWFLFDGFTASTKLCYSTKAELKACAIKVWENRLKGEELCQILKSHRV